MSDRYAINDEELNGVVGGFFDFNTYTGIMTYTHKDGSVTTHKILDARSAWVTSNNLHAQLIPEDDILAQLINLRYIG